MLRIKPWRTVFDRVCYDPEWSPVRGCQQWGSTTCHCSTTCHRSPGEPRPHIRPRTSFLAEQCGLRSYWWRQGGAMASCSVVWSTIKTKSSQLCGLRHKIFGPGLGESCTPPHNWVNVSLTMRFPACFDDDSGWGLGAGGGGGGGGGFLLRSWLRKDQLHMQLLGPRLGESCTPPR
jgi:hypothetical protein